MFAVKVLPMRLCFWVNGFQILYRSVSSASAQLAQNAPEESGLILCFGISNSYAKVSHKDSIGMPLECECDIFVPFLINLFSVRIVDVCNKKVILIRNPICCV